VIPRCGPAGCHLWSQVTIFARSFDRKSTRVRVIPTRASPERVVQFKRHRLLFGIEPRSSALRQITGCLVQLGQRVSIRRCVEPIGRRMIVNEPPSPARRRTVGQSSSIDPFVGRSSSSIDPFVGRYHAACGLRVALCRFANLTSGRPSMTSKGAISVAGSGATAPIPPC
jgi:hypothetical protein